MSYAKYMGIVKVDKKNKITHIKIYNNSADPWLNFGYGHTIRLGEGDIHKNDNRIYNKYLKGKGATSYNISSKNIWVPIKECNQRIIRDFRFIANKINKDLPKLKLTQKQADALIDLRYNLAIYCLFLIVILISSCSVAEKDAALSVKESGINKGALKEQEKPDTELSEKEDSIPVDSSEAEMSGKKTCH